jgi:hypothetical protein
MALRLLGWKVDLIRIPTMYDMNSETSQVGTEFHVKLKSLSCELGVELDAGVFVVPMFLSNETSQDFSSIPSS